MASRQPTEVRTGTQRSPLAARIAHHVPGRLRIKVVGAKGDEAFFFAVAQLVSAMSGVESVRINAASSSVVVGYRASGVAMAAQLQRDPSLCTLLQWALEDPLETAAGLAVTSSYAYVKRHSRIAESIVVTAEHLDSNLRKLSDGYLDLKVLLPLSVAAASSMHKARSKGTPMWLTLGTFAFNAFLTLHRHRIGSPGLRIIPPSKHHD